MLDLEMQLFLFFYNFSFSHKGGRSEVKWNGLYSED